MGSMPELRSIGGVAAPRLTVDGLTAAPRKTETPNRASSLAIFWTGRQCNYGVVSAGSGDRQPDRFRLKDSEYPAGNQIAAAAMSVKSVQIRFQAATAQGKG